MIVYLVNRLKSFFLLGTINLKIWIKLRCHLLTKWLKIQSYRDINNNICGIYMTFFNHLNQPYKDIVGFIMISHESFCYHLWNYVIIVSDDVSFLSFFELSLILVHFLIFLSILSHVTILSKLKICRSKWDFSIILLLFLLLFLVFN